MNDPTRLVSPAAPLLVLTASLVAKSALPRPRLPAPPCTPPGQTVYPSMPPALEGFWLAGIRGN